PRGDCDRDQIRYVRGQRPEGREPGLRPPSTRRQPAATGNRLGRFVPAAPARSCYSDCRHLATLNDLVRAGKIREIGCSNFSAVQLLEADAAAKTTGTRFVSVQNEFSLLQREPEREVLLLCKRLGLAFVPYFPLASGLLTGKYTRGVSPPPGTRLSAGWA